MSNFSVALEHVRIGRKVQRQKWPADVFVFLRGGRLISGVEPDSPMGGNFVSHPHLCLKDEEGACVVGWAPSQVDLMATDWRLVDCEEII